MTKMKQTITIRLDRYVVDFIDYNVRTNEGSRSSIIGHLIKSKMKDAGIVIPDEQIVIEAPKSVNNSVPIKASEVKNWMR